MFLYLLNETDAKHIAVKFSLDDLDTIHFKKSLGGTVPFRTQSNINDRAFYKKKNQEKMTGCTDTRGFLLIEW